jgi:two-component system response regulator HydG
VSPTCRILVTDDELSMRESLAAWLSKGGYAVETAASGEEALEALEARPFDLMLLDVKMPGLDGLAVLERVRERHPDLQVIMITAYGSIETAVQAMKQGARDYLLKPFDPEHLMLVVERLVEHLRLKRQHELLQTRVALQADPGLEDMVAASPPMQRVLELIHDVAAVDTPVLITGETGTGKELAARAIHALSERRYAPFVAINCGAQAESLLESELFGHEKGAYTGAVRARRGRIEMARDGTLFLDEIGDVPEKMQVDLLRVLEDKRFSRVGGNTPVETDFRLVSATHRDLAARVSEGAFREDFFYRVNVITLALPPLRERGEDIELLAQRFCERYARELGKPIAGFTPEALRLLNRHPWPGNVRELKNVVERAVVVGRSERIGAAELSFLPFGQQEPSRSGTDPFLTLNEVEIRHITATLEALDWNVTRAAEALGINRATLTRKLKRHGIQRPA